MLHIASSSILIWNSSSVFVLHNLNTGKLLCSLSCNWVSAALKKKENKQILICFGSFRYGLE